MYPLNLSVRDILEDEWHSKVNVPLIMLITKPTFQLYQIDNHELRSIVLDIRYELLPIKTITESTFTANLIRYIIHNHGTFHSQRLYYVVSALYSIASLQFQPIMADEQFILSLLRIFYRYRSDLSMIKTLLGLFRELIHKSDEAQTMLLKHGVLTELVAICRPTTSQSILLRIGWVIYALTHCHNKYQRMDLFPISQILQCLSVLIMYDDPGMLRFAAPCYCLLLWHHQHHDLVLEYGMDTAKLKHEMLTKLERDRVTVNLWIARQKVEYQSHSEVDTEYDSDCDSENGYDSDFHSHSHSDSHSNTHLHSDSDGGLLTKYKFEFDSFPVIPNVIGGIICKFYSPCTRPQIQAMDCNKIKRFVDLTIIHEGNGRVQRAAMSSLTQLIRHGNAGVDTLRRFGVIQKLSMVKMQSVAVRDPKGNISKMALDVVLQLIDKSSVDEVDDETTSLQIQELYGNDLLIPLLQMRMEKVKLTISKTQDVYRAMKKIIRAFGDDLRVTIDLVNRLQEMVNCTRIKNENKAFLRKWILQLRPIPKVESSPLPQISA